MADSNENDEAADASDDDFDDAPKRGKKGLIIIILLLLIVAGGGAGLYFGGVLDGMLGSGEAEEETAASGDDEKDSAKSGSKDDKDKDAKEATRYYKELPQIIANLNSGSSTPAALRAVVVLEAPSEEVVAKIEAIQPKIMDTVNTYVRGLRHSDLHGSAGAYRLREELKSRINKILYPEEINNVLFNELYTQ